jgi:hypothetical protein
MRGQQCAGDRSGRRGEGEQQSQPHIGHVTANVDIPAPQRGGDDSHNAGGNSRLEWDTQEQSKRGDDKDPTAYTDDGSERARGERDEKGDDRRDESQRKAPSTGYSMLPGKLGPSMGVVVFSRKSLVASRQTPPRGWTEPQSLETGDR